jgi:hypothetical protein
MAHGEWSKNVGTYDNVDCRQESLAWIAPEQGLRESRYSFRRLVPINAAGSRFREYRLLTIRRQLAPATSIFCPCLSCSGILPDVGESLHCDIGMVAQLLQGLVDRTAGHA